MTQDQAEAPIVSNRRRVRNQSSDENDCGIIAMNCCNGPRCKKLARFGIFITIFCLMSLLQGAADTYMRISIKQAAFEQGYDDILVDWLLISSWIMQSVVAIFAAHWSQKFHRVAWMSGLIIMQAICCFLAIIPTISYLFEENDGSATIQNVLPGNTCTNEPVIGRATESHSLVTLCMLFVGQLGMAMGGVAFYALGLCYIDDNSETYNSVAFIGVAIGLRIFGSQLGMGISLGVSAIAAGWWLGWVVICPLLFIFGILLGFFPRKIPTANTFANNFVNTPMRSSYLHDINFLPSILRIFSNKILMFNTIALVFMQAAMVNYNLNEERYLQSRFLLPTDEGDGLLDEWTSRFLTLLLKPPTVGIFVLLSALTLSKIKPKSRRLALWSIVVGIIAILIFIALIFVNCSDERSIAGAYRGKLLKPKCSASCLCPQEGNFLPVCPENTTQTYFSPCHAGCSAEKTIANIVIYENCTCGQDIMFSSQTSLQAVQGACNWQDCQKMWIIHQVMTVVAAAFISTALITKIIISIRCVLPQDKTWALSFNIFMLGIFAYIPGKISFDIVSKETCEYWSQDFLKCFLHKSPLHGNIINVITIGLLLIGIVLDVFVFKFVDGLYCFDNEYIRTLPLHAMFLNNQYEAMENNENDNQDQPPTANRNGTAVPDVRSDHSLIRSIQSNQKDFQRGNLSPTESVRSVEFTEIPDQQYSSENIADAIDFRPQQIAEPQMGRQHISRQWPTSNSSDTDSDFSPRNGQHPMTRYVNSPRRTETAL